MIAEQRISTCYGIPTTFWRESGASRWTEAQIKDFYEHLDLSRLTHSALRALRDHHRDLAYPFVSRGGMQSKYGWRVSMLARACNLLPGVTAVPVPGRGQNVHWEPVRAVDIQSDVGQVYSMDVERHHHYIADGIITHNCFYGWKIGAAHKFFGPK